MFATLIGWMYFRVAFVPGGQAIGALESVFAKLARRVTALLRRRDRAGGIREEAAVGAV